MNEASLDQAIENMLNSPLVQQIVLRLNPDPGKLREAIETILQDAVFPEQMSKWVRYFWELGEVHGLGPVELSTYSGIPASTLRGFFQGVQPSPTDEALITAAIQKIEAELPGPVMHEIAPGVSVSDGWWSNKPRKLTPEEIAADEAALKDEDELMARIAEAGAKLKARAYGSEAGDLEAAWPGFVRIAQALFDRGIKLEI